MQASDQITISAKSLRIKLTFTKSRSVHREFEEKFL